jgi:hypothetical protein
MIAHWKVAKTLHNPKHITMNTNAPHSMMKVVLPILKPNFNLIVATKLI